jgi:predicted dehydrogenase
MSVSTYFHLMNILNSEEKPHVWGIFGGGFGLYGYLPAIATLKNSKALILEKHLSFVESRSELKQYISIVKVVSSRDEILLQADSLIFAVPPFIQEELFWQLSLQRRYKYLMLEKPLAVSPKAAMVLLKSAVEIALSVRTGYSFLHSSWGEMIRQSNAFLEEVDYSLSWKFLAYHFQNPTNSWKGNHDYGGGALRFYGIHLIAYFASIKPTSVEYSRLICHSSGAASRWQAKFKIENGARITVDIDTRSQEESFNIHSSVGKINISTLSPFSGESSINDGDSRIPVLKKLLKSFASSNDELYEIYYRVNQLWAEVEEITEWISSDE